MEYYDSPVGRILLTGDGHFLTGLWFDGAEDSSGAPAQVAEGGEAEPAFLRDTKRWLDMYFRGEIPDFTPSLRLEGTDFQKSVWKILLTIPYGRTVSYGQVAAEIARERGLQRMSAQAVGGAVGRNPVSLIVPCHRVIGSDGSMVGYGGGLDRKVRLLRHEAETVRRQEIGRVQE